MEATADSRLDFGKLEFGCKHYRRRCRIRAPCCNEIVGCRHCHNESTIVRHELCRHDVKKVICLVCDTEQPVAQVCTNCGVKMGEYFCDVCKFYDDDTEKGQYHCDDCGICRVGGQGNFFHCKKCGTHLQVMETDGHVCHIRCVGHTNFLLEEAVVHIIGSCYANALRNKHSCVENSMRHHCPICYEYLFDSLKDTTVLKCGHTLHAECLDEMLDHAQYSCPICSKSVIDMSKHWKKLDEEIRATIMPLDYRYKVWILCNDCNHTTEVLFHVIGHKCGSCNSYNTRTIAPPPQLQ